MTEQGEGKQTPQGNGTNARLARIETALEALPGLATSVQATGRQVGELIATLKERCTERGRRIESLEQQAAVAPDAEEVGRLRSFAQEINTRVWGLCALLLTVILAALGLLARKG